MFGKNVFLKVVGMSVLIGLLVVTAFAAEAGLFTSGSSDLQARATNADNFMSSTPYSSTQLAAIDYHLQRVLIHHDTSKRYVFNEAEDEFQRVSKPQGRLQDPRLADSTGPADICTVTTTADSGSGSLRQCLLDAVASDTINFDTTVFPPGAPATISLNSALPGLTDNNLTIDASNAGVILNGSGLASGVGLYLDGVDGTIIRGLQILSFPDSGIILSNGASNNVIGGITASARNIISGNNLAGVAIIGSGSTGNQISGNYIGTDVTGTMPLGNNWGVLVMEGAQNNTIGGSTIGARNIISGNQYGIQLENVGTSENVVSGNYIGTDITGLLSLGNLYQGVTILSSAHNNLIGGNAAGMGNVISGNGAVGVAIIHTGTTGNQLMGNKIGTNATGTSALGNQLGVFIGLSAQNNKVGGDTAGSRNVISGNRESGVSIENIGTNSNQVSGNYIGINASGNTRLGNIWGVTIGFGAQDNIIGGETVGARNVISGNFEAGILFQNSSTIGNQVQGNYIGINATGTLPLGNKKGVALAIGAEDNVIGSDSSSTRNIISGNEVGVQIEGTTGNQVLGNYIGSDPTGTLAITNNIAGVGIIEGAQNNVVGGTISGAGNVISGNDIGVLFEDPNTTSNRVLGNYIGINASGSTPLSNRRGINFESGAHDNIVGGTAAGAGNVISGNAEAGIWFQEAGTTGNQVLGNYIGTDVTGLLPLGNLFGVAFGFGAHENTVGGETGSARNLISGNTYGVQFQNQGTYGNQVLGNYIGINISGALSLGNRWGVQFVDGAEDNSVGGESVGARNVISGNVLDGVVIVDANTTNNNILGNYIGLDSTGNQPLGNGAAGVLLENGASGNLIGISNTVAYNGAAGIAIAGSQTLENTITRNAVYQNAGLPIDFVDRADPVPAPTLDYNIETNSLTGVTCASCVVEVFVNPNCALAGTTFVGAETAGNDGTFSIILPESVPDSSFLSVTVTDLAGTTSEFYPVTPCIVYVSHISR